MIPLRTWVGREGGSWNSRRYSSLDEQKSINEVRTPEIPWSVRAASTIRKSNAFKRVRIKHGETDPRGFSFRPGPPKKHLAVHREYLEGNFCYQCNILQREAPEMAHWLSPRRSLLHPARCLPLYNITWYTRKWNKRVSTWRVPPVNSVRLRST